MRQPVKGEGVRQKSNSILNGCSTHPQRIVNGGNTNIHTHLLSFCRWKRNTSDHIASSLHLLTYDFFDNASFAHKAKMVMNCPKWLIFCPFMTSRNLAFSIPFEMTDGYTAKSLKQCVKSSSFMPFCVLTRQRDKAKMRQDHHKTKDKTRQRKRTRTRTRHDKTRQDRTGQDKARQARQDKTRQDKSKTRARQEQEQDKSKTRTRTRPGQLGKRGCFADVVTFFVEIEQYTKAPRVRVIGLG
jgi:hypothetical protein